MALSDSRIYKALVVGCGKIAGLSSVNDLTTHAGVYLARDDVEITGCVDKNANDAKAFGEQYRCKSESN